MSSAIHHIERLSPENVDLLAILFKKVFGKTIPIKNIRRKYDTTFLGKSYYGFIAFDSMNQPIAYHGMVAFRVKFGNIEEIGMQSCDSMTLKEYHGKGIFRTLGKMVEDLLKADGLPFIYGFPNDMSAKTYVKDAWSRNEKIVGFKIPVNSFPKEKVFRKLGFEEMYSKYVNRILTPLVSSKRELPNTLDDGTTPVIIHDAAFFEHKTYTNNYIIDIAGQKAWIKVQGDLLVGDIDTLEENALLKTIEALKGLGKKLGVSNLIIQLFENSTQEKILRKHFPSFPSWPVLYYNINSKIPLEKLRVNYGDLDSF